MGIGTRGRRRRKYESPLVEAATSKWGKATFPAGYTGTSAANPTSIGPATSGTPAMNFNRPETLRPPRKNTRKYYGLPGTNIGPAAATQPDDVRADRTYARAGPGKTTSQLESEGNYGQGRMAYQTRVNQRKQNVALRRRAKYMARSRRMGRQPRKYRSDRLGGLNSAISRNFGAGVVKKLFAPPGGGGFAGGPAGGGGRGGGFGGKRPPKGRYGEIRRAMERGDYKAYEL